MQKVNSTCNVGIDHPQDVIEVLVEKAMAQTATGIREQRIDRPSLDRVMQRFDASHLSEVDVDGFGIDAELPDVRSGAVDGRFVGREKQVIAVLRAEFSELVADAGGRAGDDGERAGLSGGHCEAPGVRRWRSFAIRVPGGSGA